MMMDQQQQHHQEEQMQQPQQLLEEEEEAELLAAEEEQLSHSSISDDEEDDSDGLSDSSSSSEDCDDDDEKSSTSPPRIIMGQHDARRMSLARTEREYAKRIKEAVENDPELDNLSDFMYAQLAIVSLEEHYLEENLEAVLERIQGMQDLRQQYFVRDTYEHGCTLMRRAINLLPGWFIAFSYLADKGTYLRVSTLVKFDMSIFRDPIKVRIWLAAIYYMNHAHVPDLEAARQGFLNLIECKGYDWRNQQMLSIKAFTEMAPSIAYYPILCKQCKLYNTGMFVRLLASMAKRLLPKHMNEAFEFLGDEHGHLVDVFVTPTPDAADERLLASLEEALKLRYENEKLFKL